MDQGIILQHVPHADPVFVQLVSRMSDPPVQDRERILERLPELHRLFLEKRRIAQIGDEQAWNQIVGKEVALVASMEGF